MLCEAKPPMTLITMCDRPLLLFLCQVGGFDLIWNNGPVHVKKPSSCSCYLGCHNNRVKQLKKMHKKLAEGRR